MVDGVKFYLFCVSKKLLYMFVEGDAFIRRLYFFLQYYEVIALNLISF